MIDSLRHLLDPISLLTRDTTPRKHKFFWSSTAHMSSARIPSIKNLAAEMQQIADTLSRPEDDIDVFVFYPVQEREIKKQVAAARAETPGDPGRFDSPGFMGGIEYYTEHSKKNYLNRIQDLQKAGKSVAIMAPNGDILRLFDI